jgi:hypothetical protein
MQPMELRENFRRVIKGGGKREREREREEIFLYPKIGRNNFQYF